MNWKIILLVAVAIAVVFFVKRAGQISTKEALAHLKAGALVVDVRSPGEFNSGHLPAAINLPLDEISTTLPQRVTDKNRIILLHCQSGRRSGLAKSRLQGLGYAKVFNLGSYGRAESILNQGP